MHKCCIIVGASVVRQRHWGRGVVNLFRRLLDSFFCLAPAAVYLTFCLLLPLCCPDYFASLNKKIPVTVEAGMSAAAAAASFQKAGVVSNASLLIEAMKLLGIDRNLKPGTYELVRGTPSSVALQLKNEKPLSFKLTLIPGSKFVSLAESAGGSEALLQALSDKADYPQAMRAYLPAQARERIIYLLPETYFLSPGPNAAAQFVQRSSELWYEKIGRQIPAASSAAAILKTGILASIIEGEARVESDRPILAGIFLKRMEKSMKLQSCATVVYCWEEQGVKKQHLSYADLKINSLYNTYLHAGLPPGPICVPSLQSWQSALNPQKTDFLFFFADGKGRHVFSKTYEEHLKKQQQLLP